MLTATEIQEDRWTAGFNLAMQAVSNDYRKEYAKMRVAMLDAIWTVDVKTRERILDALNGFQRNSDWNFDRD